MEVKPIKKYETKSWLIKKHYAKRMPSICFAFGLYDKSVLVGVCTYGMSPSSTLSESIAGEKYKKSVLELNRLVVNDGLPKNSLSFFVSQTIKMIPKNTIVVSFADTNMGHTGYIYQATNFVYTGLTSNTSKLIDKDGNEFHFRNIGHYQKNNKLNAKLVKRRKNESGISKIDIANYLKSYKGSWTAKALDKQFGHKDTASHWFRTDAGFSFPSIDDWKKLKELLMFDDTYDKQMTDYKMVACPQDIIKKLELTEVEIKPKHRYIFIKGTKKFKKQVFANFKLTVSNYPKKTNKRYDTSAHIETQGVLF